MRNNGLMLLYDFCEEIIMVEICHLNACGWKQRFVKGQNMTMIKSIPLQKQNKLQNAETSEWFRLVPSALRADVHVSIDKTTVMQHKS